jgi:hypothetical protein
MTKNPFVNALGALAYIVAIIYVLNYVMGAKGFADEFTAPLVMLSLFTLSTAMMGYIFLYQPVLLLVDGKKKEAVKLFLQTVLAFATITALILVVVTRSNPLLSSPTRQF